jgi:5-methylthioribose kinase
MQEIDDSTARPYLIGAGLIGPDEPAVIRALTGGVSNMVLLVERPADAGPHFVVKQARRQLRTRELWFSRLERIWREVEVLEVCQRLLAQTAPLECPACAGLERPPIGTPEILFVDRDNYLFAMTAAANASTVWKTDLLAGRIDRKIAAAAAHFLATLHGLSWRDAELAQALCDRSLFDELRIDPYYRTLARVHPELRPELERLIESIERHPLALVHADFSPKNLLVAGDGLMMVDFETGHFGDPAFDVGFFQSHLVLKAFFHAPNGGFGSGKPLLQLAEVFWRAYHDHLAARVDAGELAELELRSIQNFAACGLARIDSKSPVDYLDEPQRCAVRELCCELLRRPPENWPQALERCRAAIIPLAA